MQSIFNPQSKLCIVGAGGFGKETLCNYIDIARPYGTDYKNQVFFAEEEKFWKERELLGIPVKKLSDIDIETCEVIIAIGDPGARMRISKLLPAHTSYATLIHPSAIISDWVTIGPGSIVCAGTILTCDIKIGDFALFNLNTTVGHDTVAGNYFTTAPGVAISGNCLFGNNVHIGSNAAIREKISITDNVTIGMGSVVVKDIAEPGVYAGNPVRKLS